MYQWWISDVSTMYQWCINGVSMVYQCVFCEKLSLFELLIFRDNYCWCGCSSSSFCSLNWNPSGRSGGTGLYRGVSSGYSNSDRLEGLISYIWSRSRLDLHEAGSLKESESTGLIGKDIFQEVVNMSNSYAHEVDENSVTEKKGESKKDPRQVWCLEVQQSEKVHSNVWIPSTPNVD